MPYVNKLILKLIAEFLAENFSWIGAVCLIVIILFYATRPLRKKFVNQMDARQSRWVAYYQFRMAFEWQQMQEQEVPFREPSAELWESVKPIPQNKWEKFLDFANKILVPNPG